MAVILISVVIVFVFYAHNDIDYVHNIHEFAVFVRHDYLDEYSGG